MSKHAAAQPGSAQRKSLGAPDGCSRGPLEPPGSNLRSQIRSPQTCQASASPCLQRRRNIRCAALHHVICRTSQVSRLAVGPAGCIVQRIVGVRCVASASGFAFWGKDPSHPCPWSSYIMQYARSPVAVVIATLFTGDGMHHLILHPRR